jgi:hypothetical protein
MILFHLKEDSHNGRSWHKLCAFNFEGMLIPKGSKFCHPCF